MRPSLFELEAIFERYEHRAQMNVLGASDAETFTVRGLLDFVGSSDDLSEIELGYDKVRGEDELRDAIAKSYAGARISADNVMVTVGASEAILLALHTVLRPRDKALVCRPAYQGLYEMAEAAGATVISYYYRETNATASGGGRTVFAPDLDVIRNALSGPEPPRLLVLNSPHNPSGHLLDTTELETLLALAKRAGAHVVADEVFSGIYIDRAAPVPSAVILDSDSIVIGCLSKVYGLAGLRIGWLIGPQSFIEEARNLRFYTSLVPPSVVQRLGRLAVENRGRILARTQENVNKNYACLMEWLKDERCRELLEWFPPRAGLVMLLRLKKAVNTRRFAEELAENHKVFLVPCTTGFGMPDGYLRLGLGGNPQKFEEGLEILSNYLLSYRWQAVGNP